MSTIEIRKGSVTGMKADAVVNAANEGLRAGGGVCGVIFREAGYKKLQEACDRIGGCRTGSAVITPGFDLEAQYIIHAVGPVWGGGKYGEAELLYGAYYSALKLAASNECRSIAFPLISAGIFGYPVEAAWERAVCACRDFLGRHPETDLDIIFAVLDDRIMEIGESVLQKG